MNITKSNQKKIFISVVCICLAIVLGSVVSITIKNKKTKTITNPISFLSDNDFVWGAYSNQYAGNNRTEGFVKEHIDAQSSYIKDLNINTIKFNLAFDRNASDPILPENDYYVDKLIENKVNRYMVIENGVDDDFFDTADYKMGYEWGKTIATHFAGKINYYQMLNEVSGTAMKPNFPGYDKNDYDEKKYQAIKNYLDGMSDAIHQLDSGAQTIITAHFLGTAIIDRLIADGVDFEIIGWDWYSDMGDNLSSKEYAGQVFDIPAHFKDSGKKFWISELNRQGGSFDGKEKEQSDYLKTVIDNAINSKLVSGIFVFNLFDTTPADNGVGNSSNEWGLVKCELNKKTGHWTFGEKKPAYYTYQEIIRSNTLIL